MLRFGTRGMMIILTDKFIGSLRLVHDVCCLFQLLVPRFLVGAGSVDVRVIATAAAVAAPL
jgi:hypothetical protein